MPGFKDGPVPSPSYEDNNNNQFSEVTEFTNDVYVYGKLYADIDILDQETISFNNVDIDGNLFVGGGISAGGTSTFDCLVALNKFDVGLAGTVFTAIVPESACGSLSSPGRVGIGSTQPDGRFQVAVGGLTLDPRDPVDPFKSVFIITDDGLVGIGTTLPKQNLQVNTGAESFVVTGLGTIGVGTANPGDFGINNAANGTLRADFDGSIRVDRNIYDSQGSPGLDGYYLQRDANGIRWNAVSPQNLDGIRVQENGVDLPIGGTSQLFSHLNFVQINSNGTGTDSIVATPNSSNPTTIADIQSQDFWGFTGNDIYRMSSVGIQNNNPSTTLDVTGTLHVTNDVDFDSALNVDGITTLNGSLDVDGLTTFNETTDATSTTNASVQMDGGVGIVKNLIVGTTARVNSTTQSTDKDTGALVVEGGVGIERNTNVGEDLNVGSNATITGRLDVDSTTQSTDISTGAAVIDGGVGIAKNLNVGENTILTGRLDVDDVTQSDSISTGAAVIDGGVGIAKNLNIGQNAKVFGNLELEAFLLDVNDDDGVGVAQTDYRLASVGTGVSWRPSGVQTKRTLWVTKNGMDTNSGLLEGDAKFTIAAAAAVAQEGDTIKVRSGVYVENNPIGLRTDVAITGEDLRLVTVVPSNVDRDVFHVRRGCLIENLSFAGATITTNHPNCGGVAFPPTQADASIGLAHTAVSGYAVIGPANEGSAGRWRSPYVRNCTNFMTGSIGMKINGDHANAAFTGTNDLGQDLKSMVCDAYTQYNEAGVGVSITNNGYAQLVSIFTIGCDVGIAVSSGGQCDLTNSNSSFGNIGLLADGFGDIEFTGISTGGNTDAQVDTIVSAGTTDVSNSVRVPFDGQGAYFVLDMSDYDDTTSTAIVDQPLQVIRSLKVTNGGNPGDYSAGAPPVITVEDPNNFNLPTPLGPENILPEFSANVSAAGTITSIDVINSGRNYLPTQTLNVVISGGGSATAEVNFDPILFTVSEATETADVTGITTVTFNEFIPYPVFDQTKIKYVRLSRIITSSHSFEYIGAGTDINTSNPFQGGRPIPENEVLAINGGQVPFTSTDQKGNFRIGDGLTIDQTTSTIRGRDFNRAIQAQLTPLILALR